MGLMRMLEKKFGRYAVSNLMRYIIVLYALGFVLNMINPAFYYTWLMLDIDKLLHGQVWRIVTFMIQPPSGTNLFFLFFALYLYYMIGTSLEHAWGTFRFNLYFISGVLFNILAVIIFYVVTKIVVGTGFSYPISMDYINQALFLAFATLFPDMQFLLLFIIPIKVKYLAWLYVATLGYNIFTTIQSGAGTLLVTGMVLSIVAAMLNFIIFYFSSRNLKRFSPKAVKRRQKFRSEVKRGQGDNVVEFRGRTTITRHKCAVCGRTELDDDTLEFRFCSKCDGNYEYCSDHLYTHEHVKKEK